MKQYYTKELLEKVKELYADDYRLLDTLSKDNGEWLTGQKMAEMLNPACALDQVYCDFIFYELASCLNSEKGVLDIICLR